MLSGFVPLTLLFWGVFRVFLAKMKGTDAGTLYIVVSMYHLCMLHHWQHGVKIGDRWAGLRTINNVNKFKFSWGTVLINDLVFK